MSTALASAVGTTLLASMAAHAQTPSPAPARLRGTVSNVSGNQVGLTLADGSQAMAMLAPDTRYTSVVPGALSDIKPDSYIGSAALAQKDGTLKAIEVTIFPPGVVPTEGHFPWDLGSESTMTNGKVGAGDGVGGVVLSNGNVVTVRYPAGEKKIVIPADAPIVVLGDGNRSMLVKGAHVVLFLKKSADGAQVVGNAAIGQGDTIPPM